MSNIRVTYSGLISLGVSLITVIAGIVFSLVITRQLTPEEFGTWGLIGSLIAYVGIFEVLTSYWVTRQVARGVESARTALFSCGLFSIIGISVFIIIIFLTSNQVNIDLNIMLFSIILIPALFVNNTLIAINIGWKPQAASYGVLTLHISKVPLILFTVYFLETGLYGIIISVVFGYIFASIVLAYFAKERLRESFKLQYLKNWIKLSWIPSYFKAGNFVASLDLLIFSTMTGSVVGLAYYGAALIITNTIKHSGAIYQAMYPKLLEGGKKDHLRESVIKFFYFAFPLSAISIVFAEPALYALNPIYVIAVPVVIFVSIREFLFLINVIFEFGLQGIDEVDDKKVPSFRQLLKSKLFLLPTIRVIKYCSYVILLVIIIFTFQNEDTSQIDLIIYWSIMSMMLEIPFIIYLYVLSKKYFDIKLPIIIIAKYALAAGLVFSFIYFLMDEFLEYDDQIIKFLPILVGYVIFALMLYLGITYLIDLKTRTLFNSILSEMKKIIKK